MKENSSFENELKKRSQFRETCGAIGKMFCFVKSGIAD